jgi:hydrogenase-4 membrane subunit HyfE
MVLSLIYGWLTALCIYSLPTVGGILVGIVVNLVIYAVNYFAFAVIGKVQSNELHVGLAHFLFGLFFAVAYRAWAVPRPRRIG